MSSEIETQVIACPACMHLLRVPLDLLGAQVRCPECKAMFKAPVRDGQGGLTPPVLISRAATAGRRAKKIDPMLLLPAFGLLFCGVAGVGVNAVLAYQLADPVAGPQWAKNQLSAFRQAGLWADDPPEEQHERDRQRAAEMVKWFRWVLPTAVVVSAAVFLGGLSIVLRWNRRLAQASCVLAALNFPNLCCVPGAVAGLWGLLMLAGDEARAHFAR